jgi:hypothetical protein
MYGAEMSDCFTRISPWMMRRLFCWAHNPVSVVETSAMASRANDESCLDIRAGDVMRSKGNKTARRSQELLR